MFILPQCRSACATLLEAGRGFAQKTCHQSKEWSLELLYYCHSATKTARSLHGRDRKAQMLAILGIFRRFLRETYLVRPLRLLRRGFGSRIACFLIAGQLPLLVALAMILIPTIVFDSPYNNVYYHFARILAYDPISLLPVLLGLVTLTLMLRFPIPNQPDEGAGGHA